jgi:hypothetical protein
MCLRDKSMSHNMMIPGSATAKMHMIARQRYLRLYSTTSRILSESQTILSDHGRQAQLSFANRLTRPRCWRERYSENLPSLKEDDMHTIDENGKHLETGRFSS